MSDNATELKRSAGVIGVFPVAWPGRIR